MEDTVATGARLAARQAAEQVALTAQHLRERGITTEQALTELWAAEDRARTVTRRYQRLALATFATGEDEA